MAGDASDAIRAIEDLISRLEQATELATRDGIGAMESAAKTDAPYKRGTLRRSIFITGPIRTAAYRWTARVGPTVVYGRIRELGGHIYPKRVQWLRWERFGRVWFSKHVYQSGTHYVKRGVEASLPKVQAIFIKYWSAAVRS